jgi:hypothetical protein
MRAHRAGVLIAGWGLTTCFAACVGDSTVTPPDAGDATTTNDSGNGSDAAMCDAVVPTQPGVECFSGGHCVPETGECCVGLSGTGLIGQCADAGSSCPAMAPYIQTWLCDKSSDCPNQAPICCVGTQAGQALFSSSSTPMADPATMVEARAATTPSRSRRARPVVLAFSCAQRRRSVGLTFGVCPFSSSSRSSQRRLVSASRSAID